MHRQLRRATPTALRHGSSLGAFFALGLALLTPQAALAQGGECTSAEEASAAEGQGRLRVARALLEECMELPACNADARRRCAAQLSALAARMPTVVVHAHDGRGNDLVDVSVTINGELVASKLDGLAIPVDVGEHTFELEREGRPKVTVMARVEPTDRFRPIEVTLPDPLPAPSSAPGGGAPEAATAAAPERLFAAVTLAGVGAVGLGGFALLGASARSEERDLRDCRPDCTRGSVDAVSTRYTLANVSLAVGLVSLGAAAVVYFTGGPASGPAPSAQIDVVASPRGSRLVVSSEF